MTTVRRPPRAGQQHAPPTPAIRAPRKVAVEPGDRCAAPVLDAEKRASICGAPAVAVRVVKTGHGTETVDMTYCAEHVAAHDAKVQAEEDAYLGAKLRRARGTRREL